MCIKHPTRGFLALYVFLLLLFQNLSFLTNTDQYIEITIKKRFKGKVRTCSPSKSQTPESTTVLVRFKPSATEQPVAGWKHAAGWCTQMEGGVLGQGDYPRPLPSQSPLH